MEDSIPQLGCPIPKSSIPNVGPPPSYNFSRCVAIAGAVLSTIMIAGSSALMRNDPLFGRCARLKLTHPMNHALSPATKGESSSSSTPKGCLAPFLPVSEATERVEFFLLASCVQHPVVG